MSAGQRKARFPVSPLSKTVKPFHGPAWDNPGGMPIEASTRLRARPGRIWKGEWMAFYEHVFLTRQDVSGQRVDELVEQFKGIIEAGGGSIGKTEYWGLKNLAYRINKNRKAHFSLLNLDAPHEAVFEMERQMRINEDVLRFMTVRVDELEEEPSIQMQKKDRDDKRRKERERPQERERPREEVKEKTDG